MPDAILRLALPSPLRRLFDYRAPAGVLRSQLQPGMRLRVPFGRREMIGILVEVVDHSEVPADKLKPAIALLDATPPLPASLFKLCLWTSQYYQHSLGDTLSWALPVLLRQGELAETRQERFWQIAPGARLDDPRVARAPRQREALATLAQHPHGVAHQLLSKLMLSKDSLDLLLAKELVTVEIRRHAPSERHEHWLAQPELPLNSEQRAAYEAIRAGFDHFHAFLLAGVTGSGKTEVYLQLIRETLQAGKQALVLIPEINLGPQTLARFEQRFNARIALVHSAVNDRERLESWLAARDGEADIIIGTRSALFTPMKNPGLIIIDEEHETSFKQDSTPRYHAREVARRRSELEKIPLVLGSATPSLESWERTLRGESDLVRMPNRVEGLPMPPVVVVDIRNDPECQAGASIGRALRTAMKNTLDSGGQVILFLNLRGYSPVIWCRACGGGVKCPNCDITLTWHKDRNVALCHSCDYDCPPPTHCPTCGQAGMRFLGIGTQRLEAEVKARFPDAVCLRMDSDAMRKPGSHDQALERFRKGEVQILLGTQMIAKGLDFPNVTLVGVISADTVLHQPDLRASERTFQLISQVAGRTGRGSRGGRVLVQTSCPAEPAILKAAEHDFITFAEQELKHRREMLAPPFYHFARVIVRGPVESTVQDLSLQMADKLREASTTAGDAVHILGPAPAPIAKLKTFFRYHFQLAAKDLADIQHLWRTVHPNLPQAHEIEYTIDVDPLNMR
ncbi:MAG: primosomal protein N' [Pseudomonadales bacterium]|nr:primosomal protein N' [Pseudomonadales bacterium]